MSSENVILQMNELVDLAVSPESPHIVNFGALRSFLHALLKQNQQNEVTVSIKNLDHFRPSGDLWGRLDSLEKTIDGLKGSSNDVESLLKQAGLGQKGKSEFPISEIWKTMEIDHRVKANSNGVEKMSRIMDELSKMMKETQNRQQQVDKFMENIEDKFKNLNEQFEQQKKETDEKLKNLSENFLSKSSLQTYVTWTELEKCLMGLKKEAQIAVCQTDQSISKMRSRSVSPCSLGPSEELTDLLNRIGSLASEHIEFIAKMNDLEKSLETKANSSQLDNFMPLPEVNENFKMMVDKSTKIESSLETVERDLNLAQESTKTNQKRIEDLEGRVDQFNERIEGQDENIRNVESNCVILENSKANQCDLDIGLATKADKSLFEDLLSLSVFRDTTKSIEDAINAINARLDSHEETEKFREAMKLLAEEVDSKLSSNDFAKFKNMIEKRLKELKRVPSAHPTQSDEAAILNRRLATSFHCLSCGRPVNVVVHRYLNDTNLQTRPTSVNSSFPEMHGNSTHRTIGRPYSAVQSHRSQSKDNIKDNNWWQNNHNCVLNPKKATPIIYSSLSATEIPIIGTDGQTYKGRITAETPEDHFKYRAAFMSQIKSNQTSNYNTHVITDEVICHDSPVEMSSNNQELNQKYSRIKHPQKTLENEVKR